MCDLKRCGKKSFLSKIVSVVVLLSFLFFSVIPPGYAQNIQLPSVGSLVPLSPVFQPAVLRGIQVDPFKHLELSFIVDAGESGLTGDKLQDQTNELIHYFLASLAIPEEDLWVNLSPYENDRVVPDALGKTEMGRDLLAQDYILKQVTASLLYPDDELGKQFWQRVYKKAYEQYGTTNIPVNTFNKVWILPGKVKIYEENDRAIITEANMKVMLEEDYLSKENNLEVDAQAEANETAKLSSEIIREIVIPEIEKEINEGKNFAKVRQIYYSLVLAHWFKTKLKNVLLNKIFADLSKTKGFESKNPEVIDKIYDQYVESFKKGVCNILRIDFDENEKKYIPRKYFSGGASLIIPEDSIEPATAGSAIKVLRTAAKLGTLLLAGVLLSFATLTGKAATANNSNDDHNLKIEATTAFGDNVYDANAEFTDTGLEGPPLDGDGASADDFDIPLGKVVLSADTLQQAFQTETPFEVGDVLKSARGNAELKVGKVVPVTIKNGKNHIPVDVVWGVVKENGRTYEVFFVQLQNPSPDFHRGHMTYSHSLHGLINAAIADPAFEATLLEASGKTIQDFKNELQDILSGKQATVIQNHSYMNPSGIENPYQMSIGALCFIDKSLVILPPISKLDPLPFLGWEVGYKAVMEKNEDVEQVVVINKNTFDVKVSGEWRLVSTAQGQDARDLNNVLNLIKGFAGDASKGSLSDWTASGENFFDQFQKIDELADQASEAGQQIVGDSQNSLETLAQKDSVLFNILNLVVPNFLQQVEKNANDLSGTMTSNVENARGDAQSALDEAQRGMSQDQLAYLGFISQLLDNPYVQKKADSFINQLVENSYAQAAGGSLSAGTNAEISDVATQIAGTKMEYSATDKDGKIQSYSFTMRQITSLRYLLSLDINLLAQGNAGFDERTESLLLEGYEQATGETFQGLTNTLFEDLGNFNDPALQEILNQLFNGPSRANASGQIDLGVFLRGLVGGFQTACGEFGWTSGNIKGMPVVLNVFGGVGAYGIGEGTMDVKIHGEAEAQALLEEGNLTGDVNITLGGDVDARVRSTSGVKGFGGVELFLPKDGISIIVGYETGQEISTLNYVKGKGGVNLNIDEKGMINFGITADGTYAVGNDLVDMNNFSYNSQIDLGGMIEDLPTDILDQLNAYAQGQEFPDFLSYLSSELNAASAWNNYVIGSEDIKDGLYNMLNGLNSEFGIGPALDVMKEAFEASGAQESFDEFKEKVEEKWNERLEEIKGQWDRNVKESERKMAETTRFGNLLVQGMFTKKFGKGPIQGFVTQRLTNDDLYTNVGGTVEAGPFGVSASVQFNGLIDFLANEAAGEGLVSMGPVLAQYGFSGPEFRRLVSGINYIVNTTIKDGTFYDNIERIRAAIDNAFSNVDPKVRVCAIAALINNPQWRNRYRIDLNELQAKAFGLVEVQVQGKDGKWAASLGVENYWEKDAGLAPYISIGGNTTLGTDERKVLIGAAVFFDPMLGFTGAGLKMNFSGADIDISYEKKVTQLRARIKLESFIKALKGKRSQIPSGPTGQVEMIYNNQGAALYNNQGGSLELIDYVPFSSPEQAKEVLGGLANTKAEGKIKGSRAERKAKRQKIKDNKEVAKKKAMENVIELMIDQQIEEEIEVQQEEAGKASKGAREASDNENGEATGDQSNEKHVKGGIAFDSRKINMEIEGSGIEFDFPDTLITDDMRNLMGLVPEIINFVPVTNPISLLGPLAKAD